MNFECSLNIIFCEKKTVNQTKEKLDKYYGDSAPSISKVKKVVYWLSLWSHKYKWRWTFWTANWGQYKKIHDMVLADQRVKVREIVDAIGIWYGSVVSILNDQLGLRKLSARWVPRLLSIDHKRKRVTISKDCLELFNRNPNEFCNCGWNMDPLLYSGDQAAV